jgi:hypothetical protein
LDLFLVPPSSAREDSFFLHNSAFGYLSQRPEEALAGCVWAIG